MLIIMKHLPSKKEQADDGKKWLKTLQTVILRHAHNNEVSVEDIAESMEMKRRSFERKLKKLTGKSPKQYLNEFRLKLAHRLITHKKYTNVQKVCFEVGFEGRDHFSRIFKKRFGYSPFALIKIVKARDENNEQNDDIMTLTK